MHLLTSEQKSTCCVPIIIRLAKLFISNFEKKKCLPRTLTGQVAYCDRDNTYNVYAFGGVVNRLAFQHNASTYF